MPIYESFLHKCLEARWTIGGTSEQSTNIFKGGRVDSHELESASVTKTFSMNCASRAAGELI